LRNGPNHPRTVPASGSQNWKLILRIRRQTVA
jgi:hypothetical protein